MIRIKDVLTMIKKNEEFFDGMLWGNYGWYFVGTDKIIPLRNWTDPDTLFKTTEVNQ